MKDYILIGLAAAAAYFYFNSKTAQAFSDTPITAGGTIVTVERKTPSNDTTNLTKSATASPDSPSVISDIKVKEVGGMTTSYKVVDLGTAGKSMGTGSLSSVTSSGLAVSRGGKPVMELSTGLAKLMKSRGLA